MTSFSIELMSTEKSYTVPFKEISLCSFFVKSFDTLLNKNYTNLCKSLLYLHTSNSHHDSNVNLSKILDLLY